jgi:ketosteroid isomerase-like protein
MNTPQALMTAYEQALATQAWDNVAPLIHEQCTATFSEGTYIGKAEVEAAFRKTFDLIKDETYTIDHVHWIQETSQTAVLIYHFHWSGIINGNFASGSGRGTSVLINESGNWQLLCEHLGPPAKQ